MMDPISTDTTIKAVAAFRLEALKLAVEHCRNQKYETVDAVIGHAEKFFRFLFNDVRAEFKRRHGLDRDD